MWGVAPVAEVGDESRNARTRKSVRLMGILRGILRGIEWTAREVQESRYRQNLTPLEYDKLQRLRRLGGKATPKERAEVNRLIHKARVKAKYRSRNRPRSR